jgi:hypothetical protein
MARSRRQAATKVSFFAFQDIITSVSGILIIIVLLMILMVDDAPPGDDQGSPHAGSVKKLAGVKEAIEKVREGITDFQNVLKGIITAPQADKIQVEIKTIESEIAKLTAVVKEKNINLDFFVMPPSDQAGDFADADAKSQEVEKELAGKTDERDKLLQTMKDMEEKLSRAKNDVFITVGSRSDSKVPVIVVVSGTGAEVFSMGKNEPEAKHEAASAPAAIKQLLGTLDPAAKYVLFYVKPSGVELFGQLRDEVVKTQFSVGYDAMAENSTPKFGPSAAVPPP